MAVTETVKIVFEVDNKDVAPSFDDISKKIIGVKDETAKLTAENKALKKSIDEAFSAGKNVDDLKKKLVENEAAIRASKRELGDFQKTIDNLKTKPVEGFADGFESLRAQLKQAKEDVQKLSEKFGEFSPQANAARIRAGELADEMSDLNRQVNLLNPESKIKAFTALGQGIIGSFQLATGALQAFGTESEEINNIIKKLQGGLNIVQGISSLKGLKESFKDIQVVLGFTAAAQTGLNKATETGINATELLKTTQSSTTLALNANKIATGELTAVTNLASTAWGRFTAVLAANPFTSIAVAIGALAGAYLLIRNNTKEAAKEISGLEIAKKSYNNAQEKSIENAAKESAELKILVERTKLAANGSVQRDEALEEINSKYGTTLKNISDENELLKKLDITYKNLIETIQKKALVAAVEDELKKLYADQIALELQSIKNQENISKKKEENLKQTQVDNAAFVKQQSDLLNNLAATDKDVTDKKKNQIKDSIEFLTQQVVNASKGISDTDQQRNDKRLKQIDDEIAALQEAQRKELIGVDDIIQRTKILDEYRTKIKNKEIERAEITGQKVSLIVQKYNNDIAENELNLYKGLQDEREKEAIRLAGLKNQFEQEKSDQLLKIDKKTNDKKLENAKIYYKETEKEQDKLALANLNADIENYNNRLLKLKEFGKEGTEEYKDALLQRDLALIKFSNKEIEITKKTERKKSEIRQNTIDQSFQVYGQLFDISEELRKRDEEASISSIEKQKEQGLITEEEYQKQLKKIRQKSAEDDKKAQIFQATMSAAQAILSALGTVSLDPTARIRAVAFASIVGALNLAKIVATPIPKFNKGTLSVPGIDTGGDSVMAMLRPGEAVIPTDTNRSYAPSIKAIYQKQIKPSEINAFVLNKLSGRGSIGRDTAITASVDTFALSKAMNKNRAVEVTNANIVGKVIANEMMKAYNPRR